MKYRVYGTVACEVSIEVEADSEEEAFEKADFEFGGVKGYCGNDKLIGVGGTNESIEAGYDVVWEDTEEL